MEITLVGLIVVVLLLVLNGWTLYVMAYRRGFDRAMELAEEMRERLGQIKR